VLSALAADEKTVAQHATAERKTRMAKPTTPTSVNDDISLIITN
jgi:hypothetical protein